MNELTPSRRDTGIDAVKAAAICCVVLLHTSTGGLVTTFGSFAWCASLFWGCAVRAAVPLFLLCSGALLLPQGKELSLRKLWGKNILKIVVAMLVWAMFYKVLSLAGSGTLSAAALWQALKEVLVFNQEFHLYYLHIILLVYAFLPLTRVLVRHASEAEKRYGLIVWFALGIVFPTLLPYWPFRLLTDIPRQWMMNMSFAAIGYGVLGLRLTRRPLPLRLARLFSLAGFALVFGPTLWASLRSGVLEEHYLEGMSVGVCLLAAGLFSLLYRAGQGLREGRFRTLVTALSRASFCIYLVHVLWLYVLRDLGLTAARFAPLVSIPLLALCNRAVSFLCWFLLSKIPVVNKWLI